MSIGAILTKEIKTDVRNPYTLAGSLLFLLSSLFVCYITIKRISAPGTWTSLFWIILLFTSFNAVAKSFVNETRERMLYLYTIVSPMDFIVSKMLYNAMVMVTLSIVAVTIFSTLFEITIEDPIAFWFGVILGAAGFAIVLSLLSTIASKAGNNLTLMAILGLPILLPMILVTTAITKNAIDGIDWAVQWKYAFVLVGLNVVCFALSVILFPYLWRE